MSAPLMPKATAIWLIENTALSFAQIADFCGLHAIEIQAIADGGVSTHLVGLNPLTNGQLSSDEIARCEADSTQRLAIIPPVTPEDVLGKKKRYIAVSKRQDRPDAIAWLVKFYPTLSDTQITRLLGTTKATIAAVRNKTHWNAQNIKPKSPALLGICTQAQLDEIIERYVK
jgi:uncharacterized protein